MTEHPMRDPQDWPTPPDKMGTACVIWVDFGNGMQRTAGRAYPVEGGRVVYADRGGWCTQYVKGWMPLSEGHRAARLSDKPTPNNGSLFDRV